MSHLLKRMINKTFSRQGYVVAHIMERVLGRKRKIDMVSDFVRLSSLELVAEEINGAGLKGNVAELGVFKGEFARHINKLFPDRKLYLFDTFEGFAPEEEVFDQENKFSEYKQDFSNTTEQLVLSKMTTPENCIIRKGYFPHTAADLEDTFVFVSIDPDLYKPVYNGLKYFYPRLAKGGYIFVHDYNNQRYQGVRQAVKDFCSENQLSFFPLSDSCGTAVISK
jgi:O-methyltransferase